MASAATKTKAKQEASAKASAAAEAAPAKNKGGRPAHERDEKIAAQVKVLVAVGVVQEDIALMVGIGEKTLAKYYGTELKLGRLQANAKVSSRLFRDATENKGKEGITAAIWWEKTRMGMSEKSKLELTGKNGGPVESQTTATVLITLPDNGR